MYQRYTIRFVFKSNLFRCYYSNIWLCYHFRSAPIYAYDRKQAYLWLQGDIYRSQQRSNRFNNNSATTDSAPTNNPSNDINSSVIHNNNNNNNLNSAIYNNNNNGTVGVQQPPPPSASAMAVSPSTSTPAMANSGQIVAGTNEAQNSELNSLLAFTQKNENHFTIQLHQSIVHRPASLTPRWSLFFFISWKDSSDIQMC